MVQGLSIQLTPRPFTRREKTSIRQDVKRFEKIGRDHGCFTLEDHANFVADRVKHDDHGNMTPRSFELFRGLVSYFGEQLLYETTLARMTGDVDVENSLFEPSVAEELPGWLLVDRFSDLSVFVVPLVFERIMRHGLLPESLDELMDQIIDWNHGFLFRDEVDTRWVSGEDVGPEEYLAA